VNLINDLYYKHAFYEWLIGSLMSYNKFSRSLLSYSLLLFKPLIAHPGLFINVHMKWERAILVLKPELLSN